MDGEFTAAQSFKTQPKGQRLVVGSVCACVCWGRGANTISTHGCQTPRSSACSPLDNWSSIYPPVITSRVPVRWAARPPARLFLVSSPLVCFDPRSSVAYFWSSGQKCYIWRCRQLFGTDCKDASGSRRGCSLRLCVCAFYFSGFRMIS